MRRSLPAVIGVTPFEHSDIPLAAALSKNGALGVVDLGHQAALLRTTLAEIRQRRSLSFAIRINNFSFVRATDLPKNVDCIVAPLSIASRLMDCTDWVGDRHVLAQVCNVAEARQAATDGVYGVIAKGSEAGGAIGSETAFVLLQRILQAVTIPVWVQGGVGIHTAAACIAAGARGVVLDSQLSLLEDASTPIALRKAIAAMDGGETKVVSGFRLFQRPGAKSIDDDADLDDIRQTLGASNPANELIAVGQDAALAATLAKRYATVERLVVALRRSIAGHLRQAKALRPLAPASGLAKSLGIKYPILQGPMTRVSDRAEFARAVAGAGAMPFLALALMGGHEAKSLLAATREQLGDRPWGVGILGFVPKELHEHQTQLVLEAKPNVLLIAGGRPSQARPFEKAGIPTFLHVPSPGLLDSFLKDGAKRFVFEGLECGGHVGPRTSFVLWESAIERLLAEDSLLGVAVVFAGGIHDSVSAAMIAVMAAPLAARGADVGVLMGTAYLFTHEAVRSGAIGETFQQQALVCRETALLQTAPGHATRCVRTEFVDFFEGERKRLAASGMDTQAMWIELEKLNLGRLRIASKGLRRDLGELVQVAPEDQNREGMFMIGQVAALRDDLCAIEALHEQVSRAATERVSRLTPMPDPQTQASVDIAIIGAACVFPDAPDLEAFWSNIVRGRNSVREVPKARWNAEQYYDPEGTGEKTPSKWGAFLDLVHFDPAAYGIPPHSLAAIDPTQLLALQVTSAALRDAGLLQKGFDRERAGVIFGAESGSEITNAYSFRASFSRYIAGEIPPELDRALPSLTEDSFPGVLANVITGRIANRLDLRGPNFTVDAACASSLAAVNSACKELACRSADVMVAGAADLHNGIHDYLMFASAHALSRSGQCRTFDASADGITLGEGVAALVLKRLEDAESDGNKIYAVIKGVGYSSDGKALGLTAPRKEGQIRAVERAYQSAGMSPAEVGLVEAHGTGTVVGDRTELSALTELFSASGALSRTCTLGSVKSQIGHTKCAAGMAGMIKAMLALQRGVLTPTHNIVKPNPGYSEVSPFVLRNATVPWIGDRRNAGVSAFGFGGTNYHVVLSAHATHSDAAREYGYVDWPVELFVLRGASASDVDATIAAIRVSAANSPSVRLCDLAASVERRNALAPVYCALVALSIEDLLGKLDFVSNAKSNPGVFYRNDSAIGKVAMLFPGQGSQSPGMLAELFVAFPELRGLLKDYQHLDVLFPEAAFTPEQQQHQQLAITDTRVAQTALGIVDTAVVRLLAQLGVSADMFGGHSYGELVALSAAGAYDVDTLLSLSKARAQCILDAAGDKPGTMAAVTAPLQQLKELLGGDAGITFANHNSHEQVVIAGTEEDIEKALARLQAANLSAQKLPVACAFHSPLVAGAHESFGRALAAADMACLRAPVYSNTTAAPYSTMPDAIRRTLAEQVASPVRFVEQIEAMYAAGARVFIEAGPRPVLTNLVARILTDKPHLAVACGAKPKHGIASLLGAVAELVTHGVAVDLQRLFRGRVDANFELGQRRAPAETAWLVDGIGAKPAHGDAPRFAMRPLEKPVALGMPQLVGDSSEITVRDFLQSTREIINAQRDVLLSFLGSDPNAIRGPRRLESPAISPDQKATQSVVAEAKPVGSGAAPPRTLIELLTEIVSERTGYPVETLGVDLELEADLGIDSIKRLEIISNLHDRLGLAEVEADQETQDRFFERLAGARTLRSLATLLESFTEPGTAVTDTAKPQLILVPTLELLSAAISERTGYPVQSLNPDLELEADFGINAIKRLEIIGALRGSLGLGRIDFDPHTQFAQLEHLTEPRTLRELAALLESLRREHAPRDPAPADEHTKNIPTPKPASLSPDSSNTPTGDAYGIERHEVLIQAIGPAEGQDLSVQGKRFVISGDHGSIAESLALKLTRQGAETSIIDSNATFADADGLIVLNTAGNSPDALSRLFAQVKQAVKSKAEWIVAATAFGGCFGHYHHKSNLATASLGVCGLMKSAAKERPQTKVRVVDLDAGSASTDLAAQLYAEIVAADKHVEVGYADGVRHIPALQKVALRPSSTPLRIDSSSVVLVTGGARGITGQIAIEMARRFQCRLELVGRTQLAAEPEDAELSAARTMPSLRKVLLVRSTEDSRAHAQIEKRCRQVLAEREVLATLDAIRAAGAQVNYHAVDVSSATFGALVDTLLEKHGNIDGVVHGAGRIEDKFIVEKSEASFARVVDTKVVAARTLVEKLGSKSRFMVFFSSVSSTFGNRGQTDYAAANDVLDKLAHGLHGKTGIRVVSINWGPWRGVGMVQPELEREYERRGISLIAPAAGIEGFFNELLYGDTPQAVLTAADIPAPQEHASRAERAEVLLA